MQVYEYERWFSEWHMIRCSFVSSVSGSILIRRTVKEVWWNFNSCFSAHCFVFLYVQLLKCKYVCEGYDHHACVVHLQPRNGQRSVVLVQGDVSKESGDGTISFLLGLHQWIHIHENLDLHWFLTGEGHSARDGDHAACRGHTKAWTTLHIWRCNVSFIHTHSSYWKCNIL